MPALSHSPPRAHALSTRSATLPARALTPRYAYIPAPCTTRTLTHAYTRTQPHAMFHGSMNLRTPLRYPRA